MGDITIRTSEKGWLARLATAYKNKDPFVLIDDAGVGIDPQRQTILTMGKQLGLSAREWVAVLVALGMTVFGAWIVIAAIMDPDPTSKLWLLIVSGALLALSGGFSAIRILAGHKPPKVRVTKEGFEVDWE
jgi:hypothetical protein